VAATAWLATIVVAKYDSDVVAIRHLIILFPLTILSLALIETARGSLGKRFSFLGDISYSVYLLHFPLQLIVIAVTTRMSISQSLFYAPWFMVVFFFVLMLVSLASHHYFEVPIQRFMRRHMSG
jgi:peptidoglycan/LPS O-acetylase OafA/YrhL